MRICKKYVEYLQFKRSSILLLLQKEINNKLNKLERRKTEINNNKNELVLYCESLKSRMRENILAKGHNKLLELERMSNKYKLTDDIILLTRGIKINTKEELLEKCHNKEPLTIQWNDTVVTLSGYSI